MHGGRLLFAIQLAALAVGLTACGGDTLALDPVASAATKTSEAGSSRVEFAIAMDFGGESMEMTGTGAFDYDTLEGSATYRMEVPELGDVQMDMRMLGTKMYMRMPKLLVGEFPKGKEWIGMDLEKSFEDLGLGGLDFQSQDPSHMLQFLRAAGGEVEEAGSARVRGVETTRYTGSIDLREALDASLDDLGMSERKQQRARDEMKAMLDEVGDEELPIEVFVDDEGMLRRITMELGMAVEGQEVAMTMEMDFFDFGVDVDVQAPPAAAVLDFAELGP